MLRLRNQELLLTHGHTLTKLGQAAASENRVLSVMTDRTRKDSRTMKIATVVAMFYLPVNLVIVSTTVERILGIYSKADSLRPCSHFLALDSCNFIPVLTQVINLRV
jgi:hypothetical protein